MKEKNNLENIFNKCGYFKIENFFSKKFINNLVEDINNTKAVTKYFDKNKKLRRIEKLFNKGEFLNKLNNRLLDSINEIFKKEFVIFKDKFNAKPSGGEGFEPHYDGIFYFQKKNGVKYPGWYKYSNFFVNVLIAIDECNDKNGTLQVANADFINFEEALKNTMNDGTPFLRKDYADKLKFKSVELMPGDIFVFSNMCPHKSDRNVSNQDRRTLYYTYAESKNPNIYFDYFKDKNESTTNKGGAL